MEVKMTHLWSLLGEWEPWDMFNITPGSMLNERCKQCERCLSTACYQGFCHFSFMRKAM